MADPHLSEGALPEDVPDPLARRVARVEAAERLELVGALAEAVSHDLNNALGVIMSFSELLRSVADPGTEQREDLDSIFEAARRAGELTRWLNLFAHDRSEGTPRFHSMADCVRGIRKVATSFVSQRGLEFDMETEDGAPALEMPSHAVEDALFALLAEARDCLDSGSLLLQVETDVGAGTSCARIRAVGQVREAPPHGGLALLAPGPWDSGSDEALAPVDRLASGFGGRILRSECDDGFEFELVVPLRSDPREREGRE